ncbi:hypothetical protein MW887_007176 [Aspergillus wentii]|nr:hypothetical protein MW887_007176 [Aspergillus wentii]
MDSQSFYTCLFWGAATLYVSAEVYYFILTILKSDWSKRDGYFGRFVSVVRDFRAGKYYKPWTTNKPILITPSKENMRELSEAVVLSQRAVYADMFGFKHTMNNLDHHDHKVARTRLYGRLLQVNGPGNLTGLYPYLQRRVEGTLDGLLKAQGRAKGAVSIQVTQLTKVLASRLMGVVFFGQKLASDPEFADALLRYSQDMVSCMAAFQVTPGFLSPLVHSIITRRGRAMHLIQNRLMDIMGPDRQDWDELENLKQYTIAHNMAELTESTRDYWTPEVLSQSLLGIWFAASHQPWMTACFVLLELCARPEWQLLLREEIGEEKLDYERLEKLPLLDSFIKETVRLNPLDTMAIRRKALQDYTFSTGSPFVPSGSTVCVSSYDILHYENTYDSPNEFNGGRFVNKSKFSEVSEHFPIWGYGSLACPGRFHASLVMKLIISHLVANYDLSFEDSTARRSWSWETFRMPSNSLRIMLKRRSV